MKTQRRFVTRRPVVVLARSAAGRYKWRLKSDCPASSARTIRLDDPSMASQLVASPAAAGPTQSSAGRFVGLLVRRRVPISLVLFSALISLDMFVIRSRPRDILSLAD